MREVRLVKLGQLEVTFVLPHVVHVLEYRREVEEGLLDATFARRTRDQFNGSSFFVSEWLVGRSCRAAISCLSKSDASKQASLARQIQLH